MTRDTDHNTTRNDQLDDLLRRWHAENASTARANRDALLSRLAREDKGVVARIGDEDADSAGATRRPWWVRSAGWLPVAACLAIMVSLVAFIGGGPDGMPRSTSTLAGGPIETHAAFRQASFIPEGGRLDAVDDQGNIVGSCPLKHTDVVADIQGRFARVSVTQRYANPYPDKIEAVYTFPLSSTGAVDRMAMTIGDRVIVGEVKERTVARNIYEQARAQGHAAALLEQERPNIFTQSVANIEPGAEITVEISYVEMLHSNEGEYAFSFPMTVAPRYVPGYVTAQAEPEAARGRAELADAGEPAIMAKHVGEIDRAAPPEADAPFAPDTDQVPDASRITPMPTHPDTRAGHDISISVNIDTGGPGLLDLRSVLHEIETTNLIKPNDFTAPIGALIHLKGKNTIPNKDFVLKWRLTDETIEDMVFSNNGHQGGFLTLSMLPPARTPFTETIAVPRELIFVLDTSGSMNGFPIEKAKQVMTRAISQMRAVDAFNVITFAGATRILWESPRPATPQNIAEANAFINNQSGSGGTEMMAAINAALAQAAPDQPGRGWLTPEQLAELPADGRQVTVRARMTGAKYLEIEGLPTLHLPLSGGGTVMVEVTNWIVKLGIVAPSSVQTFELRGRWTTRNQNRILIAEIAELVPSDFITASDMMNLPADGRIVELLLNSFTQQHDPLVEADNQPVRRLSEWVADIRMRARIIESEFRKATVIGWWTTKNGERVFVLKQWGGVGAEQIEPVRPVRICMFLTDGQVGNDHAIIDAVRRHAGTTRVFSFGVGNAPNRYLLDGIALAGRGAADYVTLADGADPIVDRFTQRILTPILSDVSIEFSTPMPMLDVVSPNVMGEIVRDPNTGAFLMPDLYERTPITLHARFNHNGAAPVTGTATVRGRTHTGPFERVINLHFDPPAAIQTRNAQASVLPTLWAREKVNQLLSTDLSGLQLGTPRGDVRAQVVTLGETFSIMTPFTSFVAVDRARITIAGEPRLVHVPVELPEGMSYEGIFGRACRGLLQEEWNSRVQSDDGDATKATDEVREIVLYMLNDAEARSAVLEQGGDAAELLGKELRLNIGGQINLGYQQTSGDENASSRVQPYRANLGGVTTRSETAAPDDLMQAAIDARLDEFHAVYGLQQQPLLGEIPLVTGQTAVAFDPFDSAGLDIANLEVLASLSPDLSIQTTTPDVGPRASAARERLRSVEPSAQTLIDGEATTEPADSSDDRLSVSFRDLEGDGMQDEVARALLAADESMRRRETSSTAEVSPDIAARDRMLAEEKAKKVAELDSLYRQLVTEGKLDEAAEVREEILFIVPDNATLRDADPDSDDADTRLGIPAPSAAPDAAPPAEAEPTEADRLAEARRRLALYARLSRVLHPALQEALLLALAPDAPQSPVSVTVLLTDTDEATIKALYDAGLKVRATNHRLKIAVGVVEPRRLADLALLGAVRRVEPTQAEQAP